MKKLIILALLLVGCNDSRKSETLVGHITDKSFLTEALILYATADEEPSVRAQREVNLETFRKFKLGDPVAINISTSCFGLSRAQIIFSSAIEK